MKRSIILAFGFLLLMTACQKEQLITAKAGELLVEFVDFEQSCNWNLKILGNIKVNDFHRTQASAYLYGDMDRHNQDGSFQLGDVLRVEFEVLEEAPYPQRLILCDIPGGIPVRLLSVEKVEP
ncbi:MAG: hypothetical protein R2824_18510 [Saprospiraceae bacterium]|nr:hypothetical protein [Lewinella sp.]